MDNQTGTAKIAGSAAVTPMYQDTIVVIMVFWKLISHVAPFIHWDLGPISI